MTELNLDPKTPQDGIQNLRSIRRSLEHLYNRATIHPLMGSGSITKTSVSNHPVVQFPNAGASWYVPLPDRIDFDHGRPRLSILMSRPSTGSGSPDVNMGFTLGCYAVGDALATASYSITASGSVSMTNADAIYELSVEPEDWNASLKMTSVPRLVRLEITRSAADPWGGIMNLVLVTYTWYRDRGQWS